MNIQAAICDLDGVITQTATLHARAWKTMFDEYNQQRENAGKPNFHRFSIESDYLKYLDGMPRYDGVENFLKSRSISLPQGDETDSSGKETISGLGNRKNEIYQQLIKTEKVEYFEKNVAQIRQWKTQGIKLAVISASKNCKQILKATGLTDLFEVRVDGVVAAERDLSGKPAPDIFLEAAKELGVEPSRALIVEDSIAGIKAGKAGGFQRVIAIAPSNRHQEMINYGATDAVENLQQVNLNQQANKDHTELPSAQDHFDQIMQLLSGQSGILCLDYDGTLSPIVEDYNKAVISDSMRNEVKRLSVKIPVAIVSGRDISYIKKNVNLDGLYYAGSHGFEMEGPDNFQHELKEAEALLPVFDEVEQQLQEALADISGSAVERKKYAVAVHFRKVAENKKRLVEEAVDKILGTHSELIKGHGKKVIEIRPAIEWHKGKAVELIFQTIGGTEGAGAVVYIGDDVTDEDAFRVIENGAGILVGSHSEPTAATYVLKDVNAVEHFLKQLAHRLET